MQSTVWVLSTAVLQSDEVRAKLESELNRERKETLRLLRREDDRDRCVLTGTLLNLMLREYGIPEGSELEYSIHGKPSLKCGKLQFNISHSGEVAVLAVSDWQIGIDIEKERKIAPQPFLRSGWFAADELAGVTPLYLWVEKESVLKMLDGPITKIRDIRIHHGQMTKAIFAGECLKAQIDHFQPAEQYVGAVCRSENDKTVLEIHYADTLCVF